MNLLISAGEASGDAYGAEILTRLLAIRPDLKVQALGSARLKAAGAALIGDSARWGAVGVYESLRVVPRVAKSMLAAQKHLRTTPPGLFIAVDFGWVNIRLCRIAKKAGWKVLYFIPPGCWRRDRQGRDLPLLTDEIVTPFPWSAEILRQMGASAHFFGHPLLDMVGESSQEENRIGIAVLPGSRVHEIRDNLRVAAEAMATNEVPVRMAVAKTLNEAEVGAAWRGFGGAEPEFCESGPEALRKSRVGLVCSGTATLESAICGCPCVVFYRGSWIMNLEWKVVGRKIKYVSLPNILMDRPIVTELLQENATPERLREELQNLMPESPRRAQMLADFAELRSQLGEPGCLQKTAELAAKMLG